MPKISELNAASNTSSADLMVIIKDVNGAPSTNKITVGNFMTHASRMGAYASNTQLGVIKVGDNLTIDVNGFLSGNPRELPTTGQENGYILSWAAEESSSAWKAFSAPYQYNLINSSNTYTVTADDFIIFADPNTYGANIYIKLPVDPQIGKSYQIKNINPGDDYNVIVSLLTNIPFLENPLTGEFESSVIISQKGDSQEWVFDGSYYRHIGSQTSLPNFSADANTFTEISLQNRSAGTDASGDVVVYSDAGNPTEGTGPYVDMGINSSQYNNPAYSINGPNDSYLYSVGGDLTIGTQTPSTNVIIHAGGTTNTDTQWVFGYNNRLTLPLGGTITEAGGLTNKAIKLTPADGANANQALLIYPTAAEGDHIHLTAGGGSTELYLGDDYQYVKLANNGGIVINSDDRLGNTAQWSFSANGTTTFPGNILTVANDHINVAVNNFVFSGIAGPFVDDLAANTGGVFLKGFYYDSSGNVKIRLT